jgi:hypothetical protein
MADKIQVEVINLEADKLKAGAKYIFLLAPEEAGLYDMIAVELDRIVGPEDYTFIIVNPDSFKAYEVA